MTETERTFVQVCLNPRDLKRVEALAVQDQLTVSEFVRRLIRRELDSTEDRRERLAPSSQSRR